MAKTYSFLPDFSVFDNDEQSDVSTEDTGSSIMSRNRQVDTDTSGTGGDFLERFYRNLRAAFNDDDKFKQTFMPNKRPKPNRAEIEEYINKSTRAKGIEDALFDATGTYKTGTPSDAGIMPLEDAPDGITVPKQPEIQVEELSSAGSTGSIGEYLRTRMNKGSSFVGEGVEVADTSKLTTEQVDLAKRLAAKRRMEADAAQMNVPVADMEEEERKALEFAKTIPKLSTIKGEGLMSPKKEEPEVEAAEAEAMGSPMAQPFVQRKPYSLSQQDIREFAKENFDDTRAAAFIATVNAETAEGKDLIEQGYSKERAIEVFVDPYKFGPKMKARKEAIQKSESAEDIFNIVYGGRMGNTEEGDGFKYRGRGPIMLTGKNHYKKYGDAIGVDLVKNPDLVATDKDIGLKVTALYLKDKGFDKVNDASSLARVIGHSPQGDEAKKRWSATQEIMEQFRIGSIRPKARPDTRIASN